MRRPASGPLAVLILVVSGVGRAAAGPAFEPVPADREAMRAVLDSAGVDRTAPGPSPGEYLSDVSAAWVRWLTGWVEADLDLEAVLVTIGLVLGGVVLAAAAALAFAAAALARRRRGRPPGSADTVASIEDSVPGARDPSAWWRAMEEALESGRPRRAVEALWWWTAVRLAPDQVDGSWTTGELARRARRPDLRSPLAALDAMLYGAWSPDPEQVRTAARGLEGSV